MQKLWLLPARSPLASLMLVVYCAVVLVAPAVVIAQADECSQGRADGERDGEGNVLWGLAGLGCCLLGVGAAYFIDATPDASALLGKSSEYAMCYTEAYQDKARGKNAMYAGIGCVVSAGLWLLLSAL